MPAAVVGAAKSLVSADNDYQRALLGFEGKPWKWLTVSLQGGPDFRSYEGTTVGRHTAAVADLNPVKYYGEAAITADITPQDALSFKYRQQQWVSSTGLIPYFDSNYELTYRRKLTSKLSLEAGGRIQSSDYTSALHGNAAIGTAWQRDDWVWTAIVGLAYTVTPNFGLNAGYSYDWGRNAQYGLTVAQHAENRKYEHQLVAFGAQFKF
jgi:opacity protein-like surface antigen